MPHKVKERIKYRSSDEWVEKEQWTLIPRVSDVIQTVECHWTAYDNDVNRVKRGEEPYNLTGSNFASLRGTIAHYNIQEIIDMHLGIETEPLKLEETDNQLLIQIEERGMLDDLYDDISRAVDNFEKWWEAYNPTPIYSEKEIVHLKYKPYKGTTVIDPTKSLKGTVDFVGEINLDDVSRNAYKELKKAKGEDMEFESDTFTALIDWKTGWSKRASHHLQLMGYDYLFMDSGMYQQGVDDGDITSPIFKMSHFGLGSRYAMCVKFGGYNYKNTIYDVESKQDFFRAWDSFNSPKAKPYSEKQKRSHGMKSLCKFCPLRNISCPNFAFNFDDRVEVLETYERPEF